MSRLIYRSNQPAPPCEYVVDPVCGSLRVQVRKTNVPDMSLPKFTLHFLFGSITGVLTEAQVEQIIHMAEWIGKHSIREEHRAYRPYNLSVQNDPMSYWKFLLQAQLKQVRGRRFTWSHEALALRRKRRLEYMDVWSEFLITKKVCTDRSATRVIMSPPPHTWDGSDLHDWKNWRRFSLLMI